MNSKKSVFSQISNFIFIISIIFILSFIWINFYLRNIQNSFSCAIIISVTAIIILTPIKISIEKKQVNSLSKKNTTKYLKDQLIFGNDRINIKSLCTAFNINNLSTTNTENHYIDHASKTDYFFLFNSEMLSDSDFIFVSKNKLYNNIQIYCIDSPNFSINDINISINRISDIEKTLKQTNIIINQNIKPNLKAKISLKDVLCVIFNKKQSRSYFWFGIMLIFSSLFSLYSTYYIISGTILILLSIFARFNKKFN